MKRHSKFAFLVAVLLVFTAMGLAVSAHYQTWLSVAFALILIAIFVYWLVSLRAPGRSWSEVLHLLIYDKMQLLPYIWRHNRKSRANRTETL
jgi:hypothetical protein